MATTAQDTADSALSAANAAQTTADEAKTAAGAAQTTANKGVADAAAAQTTANTAKTTADSALSTANTAKTTADAAKTAAATAQSTADTAKTNASTAQTTANTAKTTADAAKTAATNAQTTANTAKTTADAAKTAATAAQTTANTASTNATSALNAINTSYNKHLSKLSATKVIYVGGSNASDTADLNNGRGDSAKPFSTLKAALAWATSSLAGNQGVQIRLRSAQTLGGTLPGTLNLNNVQIQSDNSSAKQTITASTNIIIAYAFYHFVDIIFQMGAYMFECSGRTQPAFLWFTDNEFNGTNLGIRAVGAGAYIYLAANTYTGQTQSESVLSTAALFQALDAGTIQINNSQTGRNYTKGKRSHVSNLGRLFRSTTFSDAGVYLGDLAKGLESGPVYPGVPQGNSWNLCI